MNMDTLLLILGGVIIAGAGFGFYKFISYMKKNRNKVNETIKEITDIKGKFNG
jgi:hypothetical protein